MIPNGIVIAFDERVEFIPRKTGSRGRLCPERRAGDPTRRDARLGRRLPGWIVDGQQRTAAIRDANVDRFPIPVTAFITDSQEEQRQQFILVNSAKPLPKSLIYELLPGTTGCCHPHSHAERSQLNCSTN